MYDKELTKGTLLPIMLKLLNDNGRMYGYEITQKVKELSKGKIDISEGALYPILHKLEAEGILATDKVFIGKRVRKYYTVTEPGKKAVAEITIKMNDFMETLQILFEPKPEAI